MGCSWVLLLLHTVSALVQRLANWGASETRVYVWPCTSSGHHAQNSSCSPTAATALYCIASKERQHGVCHASNPTTALAKARPVQDAQQGQLTHLLQCEVQLLAYAR